MELENLTLFGAIKKRMNWVGQRQEVLAHNIANADTPDFRASDLKAFDFREIVRRETMQINMAGTDSGHLSGQKKSIRSFSEQETRQPYETAPDGNSVVLEEQMQKMNETNISHRFTTEIYKKHLSMIRMALGRG